MSALRFRYQTIEFGELDIHLRTLRDRQQFHDPGAVAETLGVSPASWPLFGVVWASSEVLAQLMLEMEIRGRRILEVGCGIGLASLLLNHRLADISATDHHPEAGPFLARNVALNNGRAIPFVRAGWSDGASTLGRFDLIIGSDLLYEPDHAILLSHFIAEHAQPQCEVLLVDPGRGHAGKFSCLMQDRGFRHERHRPADQAQQQDFKGHVLRYWRDATSAATLAMPH